MESSSPQHHRPIVVASSSPPPHKRQKFEQIACGQQPQQQEQHQCQPREGTNANKNDENAEGDATSGRSLSWLIERGRWDAATARANQRPEQAADATVDPSPLALACRLGAPVACIECLLRAAPRRLRHVLDARGTPLHEAIVCEHVSASVVRALLETDEKLDTNNEASSTSNHHHQPYDQRAALCQDVDGFTPLHLLIRRHFQSHVTTEQTGQRENSTSGRLMQILEMLVSSCPRAVIIPDCGEYEEPPIVYAIKANIYAPSLGTGILSAAAAPSSAGGEDQNHDTTLTTRIEIQIYKMVECMLRYCPEAASRVFNGYRGQYTALHSAVFHGRYTNTIELLLQAEERVLLEQQHQELEQQQQQQQQQQQHQRPAKSALLGNTQGELPLHFCAMRGERPRSIALVSKVAPEAVTKRDSSGLTPFHWLWIRFVSTLLALEDLQQQHQHHRATDATFAVDRALLAPAGGSHQCRYSEFTRLEQSNIEADLQLIKRLDPPVDFLRMRHIPVEILDNDCLHWADRAVQVLRNIRERHYGNNNNNNKDTNGSSGSSSVIVWSRREAVIGLFWSKVVSLLASARVVGPLQPLGDGDDDSSPKVLVHTAFSTTCCVPGVARIVASLFPEELSRRDGRGRLPIHYAAARPWHSYDWPPRGGSGDGCDDHHHHHHHQEPTSTRLLRLETLKVLQTALEASMSGCSNSPRALLAVTDADQCLVLHLVIDTFVRACSGPCFVVVSNNNDPLEQMLAFVRRLVGLYPEALHRRHGVLKLFPFLQAAAVASQEATRYDQSFVTTSSSSSSFTGIRRSRAETSRVREELPLSITFELLRTDPTTLIQCTQKL